MRPDGPLRLSEQFNQVVELTVTARVGDETVFCTQRVLAGVWDDPDARKAVEAQLRYQLMVRILEKWTPKIHVRR